MGLAEDGNRAGPCALAGTRTEYGLRWHTRLRAVRLRSTRQDDTWCGDRAPCGRRHDTDRAALRNGTKIATISIVTSNVLGPLKQSLVRLRQARPGERFQQWHDEQKRNAPPWTRPLFLVGAVVCLAIAIALTILPGPAVVFFPLAGALFASQSSVVARFLDRAEVRGRGALRWVRARFRGRGKHRGR
jgi:hypothetical protein